MNQKLILKRSNKILKKNESLNEALASITHLHMFDLNLINIPELHIYSSAIVLYIYDNQLISLEGIQVLDLLEEIQAQNNKIKEIPLLEPFQLRKLDLRRNEITLINNLEKQYYLEELYLSYQLNSNLILSPSCFLSFNETLQILEIAGCGINSLKEFFCLKNLKILNLSNNLLNSFEELSNLLNNLKDLEILDLINNPLTLEIKYREKVIIMGFFKELDGKPIPETQREALFRLSNRKISKKNNNQIPSNSQESVFSIKHLK